MKAIIRVQQIANVSLQLSMQEVEEIRDALGKMNWLEIQRVMPTFTNQNCRTITVLYQTVCNATVE